MIQIERRIAPFWRGLNEHSDSWTENQLVAAARGRPIPAPDEIPSEGQFEPAAPRDPPETSSKNLTNLTVPISSRSQSFNSDSSSNLSPTNPNVPPQSSNLPSSALSSGSALFRGRAKTLASLTSSSKGAQTEMIPREMNLPKDPYVSGQPIEAYLYKDASECPICFLYYPPYLNKTRCCDQSICSECFVQIKRLDPHPPEHTDPNLRLNPSAEQAEQEEADRDDGLVSEPAACPFCVQPEFGVTYDPPSFRRGLTYVNQAPSYPLANVSSAMSSSSSLASAISGGAQLSSTSFARRRTTSLSATAPTVITTDRIRPDWHQKLTGARAHAARRSAAATALHTAAYLMGNRNHDSDGRGFSSFGRRGILRRTNGNEIASVRSAPSHLNMLALMSERYAAASSARADANSVSEDGPSTSTPPRGVSRRSRMDDLEEMMMMEAIRLSLASEEDRRKREEKEAKKEAKRKGKEIKKAEKVARKAGIYQTSANHSIAAFENTTSESSPIRDDFPPFSGKGKGIQPMGHGQSSARSSNLDLTSSTAKSYPITDLPVDPAQSHLERARAQLQPSDSLPLAPPYNPNPYRPSHLRNLSNASSSGSSIEDTGISSLAGDLQRSNLSLETSTNASGVSILPKASTQETLLSGTPPGGGAGLEPMFNFRSLAAMVGEDEKMGNPTSGERFEDTGNDQSHHSHQRGESSNSIAHDITEHINTMTIQPVSSTSLDDEKVVEVAKDDYDPTPEVKITTPSRVNSNQGLRNQTIDFKAGEMDLTPENAGAVSGC